MFKVSDDDFTKIVEESFSIREALEKQGLKPAGGNYIGFKHRVDRLNLSTDHFTGQAHNKGKSSPTRITDLSKFFSGEKEIQSYKLRKYLIREGYLKYECAACGIKDWRGKALSLELDHIDGNPKNNGLSNLRLLCPNCHSQTDTFRNKKRRPQ